MKALPAALDFSDEALLILTVKGRRILERAKRGHPQSIRDLGCQYIWGDNGFPKDESRARYWYTIAANAGNTEAMWDVASMYLRGEGGEKNIDTGLNFLKAAAVRRRWASYVDDAAMILAEIYQNGYFDVAPDPTEAEHWKQVAKIQTRRYRGWKRRNC